MEIPQVRKSGLPPVVDEDTEILVLGTLPSDMSLAAGQYYANPANMSQSQQAREFPSQICHL